MLILIAGLGLGLLIIALMLFALALVQSRQTGVPLRARVIHTDTGPWKGMEHALFSPRLGLTGKPDYIVEVARGAHGEAEIISGGESVAENLRNPEVLPPGEGERVIIPVEVKPGRTAPEPRPGDVLQLAAYGLLIEEEWGVSCPYGLLKYKSGTFRIDFTAELRIQLALTLSAMRRDGAQSDVLRSHNSPARCRGCGFRDECTAALASDLQDTGSARAA